MLLIRLLHLLTGHDLVTIYICQPDGVAVNLCLLQLLKCDSFYGGRFVIATVFCQYIDTPPTHVHMHILAGVNHHWTSAIILITLQ